MHLWCNLRDHNSLDNLLAGSYKKQNHSDLVLVFQRQSNAAWSLFYREKTKQVRSNLEFELLEEQNVQKVNVPGRYVKSKGTVWNASLSFLCARVLNQIVFLVRFCCYIRVKDSVEG